MEKSSRSGLHFKGKEKKLLVQSLMAPEITGEQLGIPNKAGRLFRRSQFHLVDLAENKIEHECSSSLIMYAMSRSMVALDHTVYLLGGLTPTVYQSYQLDEYKQLLSQPADSYPDFYFGASCLHFDPDQSQWVWRRPTPIAYRTSSPCVGFLGKIYAFDGAYFKPAVLDPNVGHWKKLRSVPKKLIGCQAFPYALPDPSRGRIFLHLSKGRLPSPSLYAFTPPCTDDAHSSGGTWTCIADNFQGWTIVAAVVEDVIYFYSHKFPCLLRAFDVLTCTWLEVDWASCFENNLHLNSVTMAVKALISLGNKILCLAAVIPISDGPVFTRIGFPKFRVKRNGGTVSLIPISFHSYDLPAASQVNGFLAVEQCGADALEEDNADPEEEDHAFSDS